MNFFNLISHTTPAIIIIVNFLSIVVWARVVPVLYKLNPKFGLLENLATTITGCVTYCLARWMIQHQFDLVQHAYSLVLQKQDKIEHEVIHSTNWPCYLLPWISGTVSATSWFPAEQNFFYFNWWSELVWRSESFDLLCWFQKAFCCS